MSTTGGTHPRLVFPGPWSYEFRSTWGNVGGKIIVHLVKDLTAESGGATIRFAINSAAYELDRFGDDAESLLRRS